MNTNKRILKWQPFWNKVYLMERMHLMFKYSKTKMELTVSCDVSLGGCQENFIAVLLSGFAVTCVGALSITK